jgi:hypothetical protein
MLTLDGFVNVQIQPHVSGYLVNQNYREGSLVARNQVLFERLWSKNRLTREASLLNRVCQTGQYCLTLDTTMSLSVV